MLNMDPKDVRERVMVHPQLKALYWTDPKIIEDPGPTRAEVLNGRDLDNKRSLINVEAPDTDLAEMVSEADRLLMIRGLKKIGLGDKALHLVRNLGGLAQNTGKMISGALDTTHRSYFVQMMRMFDFTTDIYDKLMEKDPQSPNYIKDDEIRVLMQRNFIEAVKTHGSGYAQMLQGAQAMVEMMIKSRADEGTGPKKKKKPGWNSVSNPHGERRAAPPK